MASKTRTKRIVIVVFDGVHVTTNWAHADRLASEFPAVTVDAD